MAAVVTVPNERVYKDIGSQLAAVGGIGIPNAGADMTALRALVGLGGAAFLVIEIDAIDYAIPLLLTS